MAAELKVGNANRVHAVDQKDFHNLLLGLQPELQRLNEPRIAFCVLFIAQTEIPGTSRKAGRERKGHFCHLFSIPVY